MMSMLVFYFIIINYKLFVNSIGYPVNDLSESVVAFFINSIYLSLFCLHPAAVCKFCGNTPTGDG